MKIKGGAGLILAISSVLGAAPALAQAPEPTAMQTAAVQNAFVQTGVACLADPNHDYCKSPLIAHVVEEARATLAAEAARAEATLAAQRASVIAANAPQAAPAAGTPFTGRRLTSEALAFAREAGSPPGAPTLPHGGGGADISFAANTADKTAALTLDIDMTGQSGGNPRTLSFTASTPVVDGQDFQNIATQDGLAKSSNIGLKYSYLKSNLQTRATDINGPAYQASCNGALRQLHELDPKFKDPPGIGENYTPPPGGPRKAICSGNILAFYIGKDDRLDEADRKQLIAGLDKLELEVDPIVSSVWMFSGNAKVGLEKHKFFDPLTLDPGKVDRTPWQVGLAATRVFHGGDMSWTLSYAYQRVYNDGGDGGQPQVLCKPAATPFISCINGFIGHPVRGEQHLFTADFRYIAADLLKFPIGVDPTLTYDGATGEYGVQFPIYAFANKSKGLTGGVRYDWTSDKHHSVVGVFVTSAFCVLPGYSGCPTGDK